MHYGVQSNFCLNAQKYQFLWKEFSEFTNQCTYNCIDSYAMMCYIILNKKHIYCILHDFFIWNKENLRDLIAATGLVILLKLD